MWRIAFLVLAVGCTEHGESPPGGTPKEIGPFSIQFCTAGSPGEASCPINVVPLDSLGAPGGAFRFDVQALGSGMVVASALDPGGNPVHVGHPALLAVRPDGMAAIGGEFSSFDMVIETTTALPSGAFVGEPATDQMILRFETFDPL